MKAILMDQIDCSCFYQGKIYRHNKTDFSIQFLYNGIFLIFQTPDKVKILYGLTEYKNPHEPFNSYCMSITLDESKDNNGGYMDKFTGHIMYLDDYIRNFRVYDEKTNIIDTTGYNFESPIRIVTKGKHKNKKFLRIKIISDRKLLRYDRYCSDGREMSGYPTIEDGKKAILHDTEMYCTLVLKKLWFSTTKNGEKKRGYSYCLHATKIPKIGFVDELK